MCGVCVCVCVCVCVVVEKVPVSFKFAFAFPGKVLIIFYMQAFAGLCRVSNQIIP